MMAWRRWQDWVNVVLGVLLFIAVWVFHATTMAPAEWTGIVIGVLLFLVGLYLLANPRMVNAEWIQVVLGVLLFISPWVLRFTALTLMSWTAWVIGILAIIFAGWVLLTHRHGVAHPNVA